MRLNYSLAMIMIFLIGPATWAAGADAAIDYTAQMHCFGEAFEEISLENQFTDFKFQRGHGTCFAQAATNVVEAALFRQSGEKKSLSAEFAAAAYCGHPKQLKFSLNTQRDFAKNSSFFDPLNVVEGGEEEQALDEILSTERFPLDSAVARQSYDRTIQEVTRELKKDLKGYEDFYINFEKIADLEAKIKKATEPAGKQKLILKLNKLIQRKAEIENRLETAAQNDQAYVKICDQFRCYFRKLQTGQTATIGNLEKVSLLVEMDALYPPQSICSQEANRETIGIILHGLCLGIPMTGALIKGAKWIAKQDSVLENRVVKSGHVMAMQGLRRDAKTGRIFWVLRNSWGPNTYGLLPIEESCHIADSFAAVNRKPLTLPFKEDVSELDIFTSDSQAKKRIFFQGRKESKLIQIRQSREPAGRFAKKTKFKPQHRSKR